MKVKVTEIDMGYKTRYKTVQIMDPDIGLQNNITAQKVYHRVGKHRAMIVPGLEFGGTWTFNGVQSVKLELVKGRFVITIQVPEVVMT